MTITIDGVPTRCRRLLVGEVVGIDDHYYRGNGVIHRTSCAGSVVCKGDGYYRPIVAAPKPRRKDVPLWLVIRKSLLRDTTGIFSTNDEAKIIARAVQRELKRREVKP